MRKARRIIARLPSPYKPSEETILHFNKHADIWGYTDAIAGNTNFCIDRWGTTACEKYNAGYKRGKMEKLLTGE